VAIRVFDADESIKQFIPAALGVGLALSPLSLTLFNRLRMPISSVLGMLWLIVAAACAAMVVAPSVYIFIAAVCIAQIAASQGPSLLTSLYSRNYPSRERGQRLSTTFVIASLLGAAFGYVGGELMDVDPQNYRLIFAGILIAALGHAYASRRIPSDSASSLQTRNVIQNLSVAWQDRLFAIILVAWMLMGLGNLMLIPLRVEYLANPDYGINASNAQISALLVSTVLGFRVISTKVWGFFFDRINMITLRVILNTVFILSIAFFFFTTNLWLMAIGSALLGTAFGGGGIMWTLYVTKIAPPDKVTAYMSVHGFMTGLRMTIAPFLGYAVMIHMSPRAAAVDAIVLILLSTVIFIPLRNIVAEKSRQLADDEEAGK